MRKHLVLFIIITTFLYGCTLKSSKSVSGNEIILKEDDAIAKVLKLDKEPNFLSKSGKIKVVINRGGAFPGVQTPVEFETKTELLSKNVYIITLSETWDNKAGQNTPNYWKKYKVDTDNVILVETGGKPLTGFR